MKKNKVGEIADKIIESIENGTAPWLKPWKPEQCSAPYNPASKTVYKGSNFIYLSCKGKSDPRWCTYKQAQDQGWQVKKGAKGTSIQFWSFTRSGYKKDNHGKIIIDKNGEKKTQTTELEKPVLRYYNIFNADQIKGMPVLDKSLEPDWKRHEKAESIIKNSGAEISHVKGDRAYYRSGTDKIILPEKNQFSSADKYYSTGLHELGHWTGHKSRLDRGGKFNSFGSAEYAREEMRAEIASYMVGMQLKIGHDPGQHLAYVDSWVKILKDKPTEIYKACADAEKIRSYLMAFEKEKARDITYEITIRNKKTNIEKRHSFTVNDIDDQKLIDRNTKNLAIKVGFNQVADLKIDLSHQKKAPQKGLAKGLSCSKT